MDASNSWGQQQAAHPAMFQQQGQPTHEHQQALLEQHHRQAAQQQSQRQAMAALSMQYGQPSNWGTQQHSTSAQTANLATGGASQVQQPWGITMPQQGTSTQAAGHTMFGATQAQQASAMHPLMTQQGAMTHHPLAQSTQPSGQQLLPNTSQFSTPTQAINPLANLLAQQQQQHTTPTFNTPPSLNNPQSTTTAEALSLTHLAQNMDPTARKQLIQLLASHEPALTPVGAEVIVL